MKGIDFHNLRMSSLKVCLCILLGVSVVLGGENYGRLDKGGFIEHSMEYLELIREDFEVRAERLKEFDGTVVELDYQYYANMTPEQEKNHRSFLAGRQKEDLSEAHIGKFLEDYERIRVKLAEAEANAFPKWEEKYREEKEEIDLMKADLFGTDVEAGVLGVVLDNSPSMSQYLDILRQHIGAKFPNSHFIEVKGSFLTFYPDLGGKLAQSAWYFADPKPGENPFDPRYHAPSLVHEHHSISPRYSGNNYYGYLWDVKRDNLSAFRALIELHGVDTLYWFCDFDDEEDDQTIEALGRLVKEHDVRLYIHTVGRRPPRDLDDIVDDSGGDVLRGTPRD